MSVTSFQTLQLAKRPRPAMDLNTELWINAPNNKPSWVDFERDSVASYFDANGVLQWASANVLRPDYDPLTGEYLGWLIEGENTTHLRQASEDPNTWVKTRCTVDSEISATLPTETGSVSAVKATSDSSTTSYIWPRINATSGNEYVWGAFLKAGTVSRFRLRMCNCLPDTSLYVDLSTGAITNVSGSPLEYRLIPLKNDWFYFWISQEANGTVDNGYGIIFYFTGTYATDDYFFIWGTDFKNGRHPSSYIKSTGSPATRKADLIDISGTDFTDWWNSDEGLLYVEGRRGPAHNLVDWTGNQRFVEVYQAAGTNDHRLNLGTQYDDPTGYPGAFIRTTSGIMFGHEAPSVGPYEEFRCALALKANDHAVAINGVITGTETTLGMPASQAGMTIGVDRAQSANWLNGHIKRIVYWPERLSNTELEAITRSGNTALATKNYTTLAEGCYVDGVWYEGRIPDTFTVRESLSEQFYGFSRFEDLTIELSNTDGELTDLYTDTELREYDCVLSQIDREDGTDTVIWQVWGKIQQVTLAGAVAELNISLNREVEPFEKMIPEELVDTSITWENEETPAVKAAYERDLGKPVPIIFGHARQVPLALINNDVDNDKYDYLVGHGVTEANNTNKATAATVYRDERTVLNTEYTAYDGGGGNPAYSGKAFIRFVLEQRDFSGQFHTLAADWYGLELSGSTAERNFVRCIEHLLKNDTWGLGETIDQASFDTAAALAAITARYCDGAIATQRKALDVLNELLFCAQARLWKDPTTGAWKIHVDQNSASVLTLYQGSAGNQDNITEVRSVTKTNTKDAIKTLKFQYFRDGFSNEWKLTTEPRTVNSGFGVDKVETLPWVNDQETADRIACYHAKLRQYSDEWVELSVGQEARYLQIAHVVTLDVPRLGLSGLYRIVEITRGIGAYDLMLCSYDSAIFTYSAGTLPDDPDSPYPVDWSKTDPDAPINLSVFSINTGYPYVGAVADPGTTNPENFSHIMFKCTGPGYNRYVMGRIVPPGPFEDMWGGFFDNVAVGETYTVTAVAVNMFGRESTSNPSDNATVPAA